MRVLELFSGTHSVGKVADELGWETVSVDMILPATHREDIMKFNYKQYPSDYFDIVWASPPCVEYSKLQDGWLGRMRKGHLYTKERQEICMAEADKLVLKSLEIINYFNPTLWYIENPRGKLKQRPIMKDIPYITVDYCRYSNWGYRKTTNIWTNNNNFTPKTCEGVGKCPNMLGNLHATNLGNTERRIKTKGNGQTQQERYRIPPDLIRELFCI
jgi:site-specific DNA-cytosine methylase